MCARASIRLECFAGTCQILVIIALQMFACLLSGVFDYFETQSIGDTNFSRSSAWSTVSYYTHFISTGDTHQPGKHSQTGILIYISITKQSVWETLKHNQLGIHINRGYTVNWGYSFWQLVSMVHCVSLHTLDINWGNTSTGDIIVSKQSVWEAQKNNQLGIHSQTGILIYISITKQSVSMGNTETQSTGDTHQPGIHSQLGIFILAARQHGPRCLITHT